jgi:hypothetical protein
MKLPSRMLDLSVPLDNETSLDPPIMRPKIDYKTNKENAWMLLESFPGLRAEDLPDGEGWAFELRCGSNPTRSRQQGRGARLYRDLPRGRLLASRAPRCRPHRSDRTRARHPLRRHQPAHRL